jgi:hypothetical protein
MKYARETKAFGVFVVEGQRRRNEGLDQCRTLFCSSEPPRHQDTKEKAIKHARETKDFGVFVPLCLCGERNAAADIIDGMEEL